MTRPTLLAGALLVFAPLASAQQDAAPWFEKMAKMAGKAMEADLTLVANSPRGRLQASGRLVVGDREHFQMDMVMEIDGTAMGMQEPLKVSQTIVADGETLWIHMENPMMGGTQVMKMSLAQARKLGEEMSMGMPGLSVEGGEVDMAAGIGRLQKLADFQVVSENEKTVRLSGTLNEDGAELFSGGGMEADTISLVLDRATGFPVGMELAAGEETAMFLQLKNLRFPEKVDLTKFRYTPPEGVAVMDLALLMGLGQEDEEGDF